MARALQRDGLVDDMWRVPVGELMSRALVSVGPLTALDEVQRTLVERDISAVPVIDDAGALRGILTTKDLLREARIEIAEPDMVVRITPPPRTAGDVMRRRVITVDEDAPISEAAARMLAHRIHRLVVVRGGVPVGILSTRDAMRAVVAQRVDAPLSSVMTIDLVSIDQSDPVDEAVARLDDANVRGLVVLDGSWPVGVFTHREAIHARALPPPLRKLPVERVMSYETICLDLATPLYRVASYARQMRVRRIFAVEKRQLRGVATGFDLLRVMTAS